jgi:hypothetical protein
MNVWKLNTNSLLERNNTDIIMTDGNEVHQISVSYKLEVTAEPPVAPTIPGGCS